MKIKITYNAPWVELNKEQTQEYNRIKYNDRTRSTAASKLAAQKYAHKCLLEQELTDREQSLKLQLLEFAREYPEGFTLDTRSRKLHEADRGYVVAVYNDHTDNIPATIQLANEHELVLIGGWWDEQEERYEFDACQWFRDFSEAVAFAKANKQKAIYDCEEKAVIDLRVKSC